MFIQTWMDHKATDSRPYFTNILFSDENKKKYHHAKSMYEF